MNIFYSFEEIETVCEIKNAVVTTGSFDGVHIGHKAIINRINRLAREINGESCLITFNPHPRKVLFPETEGKNLFLINSQEEKIELLRKTGLDNLFIIPFTLEFSKITSTDFIRNILIRYLHCKLVVIGYNHHFGHNREGDYTYLYELGKYYNFKVEEIPEQDIKNEAVSSTKIRKALLEGDIQRANAYLDHHFIITGKLNTGSKLCNTINLSTYFVEINDKDKLVPNDGVYAVNCLVSGSFYKGMLNIKKLLDTACNKSIELHLFNYIDHAEGSDIIVYFAKRMRNEIIFHSEAEMKKQLLSDKAKIDELIY